MPRPADVVAVRLSAVLAVVAGAGAALTLLVPSWLHGNPAMNGSARGTALVMLGAGLPLLALVLVARLRLTVPGGARAARLGPVWLGVLGYLVYNSVLFLFAEPFNELFLVHTSTLGLAVFAVIAAAQAVSRTPLAIDPVGARWTAGLLGVITGANILLWLRGVVPGLGQAEHPAFLDGTGLLTNPIYTQDLAFWLPLAVVTVVWLRQRRPWGVLLGGAALTMWALESISIAVDQWWGAHNDPASPAVSASVTVPFAILAVVLFGVLAWYLRRTSAAAPRPAAEEIRQ